MVTTVAETGIETTDRINSNTRAHRHRLKNRTYRKRLVKNDCFGESILLIGDKLWFNMVAEEESVMLELNRRSFSHFIQHRKRVVPELGSFLALQYLDAADTDDNYSSDLTKEMELRISEFYKLPDEVEEVEEQERSLVRAIDLPLSEHEAKRGLNLASRVFLTHGNDWLKASPKLSLGKGKDATSRNSPLKDGDGTGSLAYLRSGICVTRSSPNTSPPGPNHPKCTDTVGITKLRRTCEELSILPRNVVLLSLGNANLRLDNISMTTKEGRAIGAALLENKYVTALNLSGNRLFNEAFVNVDKSRVGDLNKQVDQYIWNGTGIFEALLHKGAKHVVINLQQTQLGAISYDGFSMSLRSSLFCKHAECPGLSFLQMKSYPVSELWTCARLHKHTARQENVHHTETRNCRN